MPIALPLEIEEPSGGTVNYQIAHLAEDAYVGPELALGWEQGNAAAMSFFCNWDDLDAFIPAILGENEASEETGVDGRWYRHLPHQYPTFFTQNLYASRIISLKGIPGPNPDFDPTQAEDTTNFKNYPRVNSEGRVEYLQALVTVQYEPALWPMTEDEDVPNLSSGGGEAVYAEWERFVTVRKNPRLEWFEVPGGHLYWVESPEKTGDGRSSLPHNFFNVREETTDYLITLHRIPSPITSPQTFIGNVNQYASFMTGHPQVPSGGFDAQTMLLTGMQEHIFAVAHTDIKYYTYEFLFSFKSNGWNKTRWARIDLTPPTFDYTSFTLDGKAPTSTNVIYRAADMRLLFLPGA
jgi:hypothetical protein